jgi:hypothetical protein
MSADERFQREKAAFEQTCNSFRSLNQLMWQVPLIATSLTGGLWYGVANGALNKAGRFGLLLLAALADFGLGALVLPRVRNVMQAHLDDMAKFYPTSKPKELDLFVLRKGGWFGENRGAMRVYALLLLLASLMSVVAAVYVLTGSISPKTEPATTITTISTANGVTTVTTSSTSKNPPPILVPSPTPAAPASLPTTVVDAGMTADAAVPLAADATVSDGSVIIDAWASLTGALLSIDASPAANPTTPLSHP